MAVTWDPNNMGDPLKISLSNGNLTVDALVSLDWEQALATLPRSTGKYYFEVVCVDDLSAYNFVVGVQNGNESKASYVGDTANGWGYMSNGRWYNSSLSSGHALFNDGGTVMVACDLDNNKLWFGLNGSWEGNPGAGTGESFSNLSTGDIYPATSPYSTDNHMTAQFTEASQTYALPSGFSAWDEDVAGDCAAAAPGASDTLNKMNTKSFNCIAKINTCIIDARTDDGAPASGEVTAINTQDIYQPIIPAGLIIPLQGAGAVPTNWTIFTDADGYYIVGAGSTYAIDATAAGSGDITATAALNGGHLGITVPIDNSVATSGGRNRLDSLEADHTHTFNVTYVPPYQELRLIKADSALAELPQNGVFFWYGTDNLTSIASNVFTDGYMFKSNTAAATGGSATASETSDAVGTHRHGVADSGDGSGSESDNISGGHSHTETFTMTNNLKIAALAAWTDAAAAIDFADIAAEGQGMIGMWDGTIGSPPDGWYVCDGTNGTPDLRDYFVKTVAYGSAGSKAGDGSVDYQTAGTITHAAHNHTDNNEDGGGGSSCYHAALTEPAHAQISDSEAGWLPPYYALAFIQFGG